MNYFISILLLAVTITASATDPEAQTATKKLVFIGDSLTEGYGVQRDQAYPALVQKKINALHKPWLVINSGVSGSTSASAASRVDWMLQQKPHLVVLALGANDGLRGNSVKNLEQNLAAAIDRCLAAKVKVILVGMKIPPNYGAKYRNDFESVFPRLSKRFKIPLIPFLLVNVAGVRDLNQTDQIHPNEKGHVIIAETIFKALEPHL